MTELKPWFWVFGGSLAASGILLTFLILEKKKALEQRANELRMQLTAQSGTSVYAQQMTQMRHDLETYTDTLAHRAADDHIGRYYGLTPERMTNIQRLARQLGL